MRNLRERITPARWRNIHFGILGIGVCLVLLALGLRGSPLDGIPILAALALMVADFIGDILFFRCPKCGGILWQFWSGHCHSCGTYIDLRQDAETNEKNRK